MKINLHALSSVSIAVSAILFCCTGPTPRKLSPQERQIMDARYGHGAPIRRTATVIEKMHKPGEDKYVTNHGLLWGVETHKQEIPDTCIIWVQYATSPIELSIPCDRFDGINIGDRVEVIYYRNKWEIAP
jgi:hypothetical protein